MRPALPGETLSDACGHHCGIRSTAEGGARMTFTGHCACPECQCGLAQLPDFAPVGYISVPMCDRRVDRRLASAM